MSVGIPSVFLMQRRPVTEWRHNNHSPGCTGNLGGEVSMRRTMPIIAASLAILAAPSVTLAAGTSTCHQLPASPASTRHSPMANVPADADAFTTAYNYVVSFYPRWFTYHQSQLAPCNQFIGPHYVGALYHAVVAINVDTLYTSTILDVSAEPVIVTVPATADVYSVLQLDQYGKVFKGIPGGQPGVYALTGPGWSGPLPDGVIAVPVPYDRSILIFRADRYSATGQDMQAAAEQFRESLKVEGLSAWLADPSGGATKVLPEIVFGVPYKSMADNLLATQPLTFLEQLQSDLQSPTTQPLTADEQTLSDTFDALMADVSNQPLLEAGAQAAHAAVEADYLSHTLPGTSWVNFTNIAAWDTTPQGYLDRSAITEFIQYANDQSASAYFHAFNDGSGVPLDGSKGVYTLKFSKEQLPPVSRFWSVTAYLPDTIELVPNLAGKFNVASYTPGLATDADGSVTVTLSPTRPYGVPKANWLPVPRGPFNVMLRGYGPQGSLADNTYVPPPILLAGH